MERASGIDPARLVVIFYVLAALVLGVFLDKVTAIALSYARFNDRQIILDLTVTDLAGYASYAVGFAAAGLTWRHPRTRVLSLEVASELKKVTWPSLRETRASTAAVVVATFVAAAILGLFDVVWGWLSGKVY